MADLKKLLMAKNESFGDINDGRVVFYVLHLLDANVSVGRTVFARVGVVRRGLHQRRPEHRGQIGRVHFASTHLQTVPI